MNQLNKDILRLAGPSILANMTVPLVGMADVAITGHLGSAAVGAGAGFEAATLIGGISIGSMLFDLVYWNFSFLRTGTGGLTAQAYGRYRRENAPAALRSCADTFSRAFGIALLSGIALIALQWLVVQFAFLFVRCSPEARLLAERYFYLRIWAAPATLSLFAFKGWFIGMQDTVSPMLTDILVNAVNIAASIVLAFGLFSWPGIGYDGVALGTVLAQWSGFAFAAALLLGKYRKTVFAGYGMKEALQALGLRGGNVRELRRFFSLNRDIVVHSLGLVLVYIGYTVLSARYGDTLLAASSIIMHLLMFFSYFTDGFAYAGEALTGKYIGMQERSGTQRTVRYIFVWSMSIAGAFVFLYWFTGVPMLRLMTSDPTVVEAGKHFLPWLVLMPLLGCPAFIWDGIYVGATASKELRNSAIYSAAGFFAAWFAGIGALSYMAPRNYGVAAIHILLAAYFVHLMVRTVYQTALYRKSILTAPFAGKESFQNSL